ncbi:MAG: GntR family transcriptional regulator [Holdemanella porci]
MRLKNTLLNRIDNGELLPGERLESERDLAEKCGVNRQTVRSALNVLIEDGVLIKVPYKGTFVAKQIVKPSWGNYDAINEHRGFSSFLKAQGFQLTVRSLLQKRLSRQLRFVHT